MNYSKDQAQLFKRLPKVDELANQVGQSCPHQVAVNAARAVVAELRGLIKKDPGKARTALESQSVLARFNQQLSRLLQPSLRPVVNATGVVVHTNLGRSLLPKELYEPMMEIACRYSNLEFDLEKGVRGSRYSHVQGIICELTGAEAALVVNNNAAAVLLVLGALAKGKEVVVSRSELVEIGGSFRIPDVMRQSGARLVEVGATNRTHLRDYEMAIGEDTALLLKVHQSNFKILGFTKSVTVEELRPLADKYNLYIFEDLGSGSFVDFSRFGLTHEPTVQEALRQGADVVSFSGDKLLGGPQAGIILGKREIIEAIRKHPLNRALRIDKLTLAALESLLRLYREPEKARMIIPTLRMLTEASGDVKRRAQRLLRRLKAIKKDGVRLGIQRTIARVGGGALPLQEIPSYGVFIAPEKGSCAGVPNATEIEEHLRSSDPPIIARIEEERVIFDAKTILPEDLPFIERAVSAL